MSISNFHITGSAELLRITFTVRDNQGRLLPGVSQHQCLLPPLPPQLRDKYRAWKQKYAIWLRGKATLTPSSPPIEIETNISISQECQQIGNELIHEFNQWINRAVGIQAALLSKVSSREYCQNPSDFCFVLNADTIDPDLNLILQRLPLHAWDLIQEYYPDAEIALSTTNHLLPAPISRRLQVLVVLGYDPNIDLVAQQLAIGKHLADANLADVTYWDAGAEINPIPSLFSTFNNNSPHILFFIGHSESTDGRIRIWLNQTEYISPEASNFKNIFKGLKNRGLIFAAFISCDGLGIAQKLSELAIPYLLVSREILPVHVAREFLDEFLNKATEPGVPIHIALSHARQHLQYSIETRSIDGCPNASTLPVLFQAPEQHSYILNPISNHQLSLSVKFLNWLRQISNSKLKKTGLVVAGFILAVIPSLSAWRYIQPQACDGNIKNLPYLSCGEKSLLDSYKLDAQAIRGMTELGEGKYKQSIENLKASWIKNQSNPEVLIALNNAKARNNKSIPIKNIAVLIPASTIIEKYVPISILAAVAEAQDKWNKGGHNYLLQVTIANDNNNPQEASENAVTELLKRKDILGTVGPYSSTVAEKILKLYQQSEHTLISGTNTSTNLSNKDYYFRTVSDNSTQASQTVEYLLRHNIKTVELLHGEKSFAITFTASMKKIVKDRIKIYETSLSNKNISPKADVFDLAKQHGSQALILLPDPFPIDDPQNRENVHQIISHNIDNIPIIGNELVNDPWLFERIEKQKELKIAKNLSFSLTWDGSVDKKNISPRQFKDVPIWWKSQSNYISHRTILTYDAANILLEAIDRGVEANMQDSEIKQKLPVQIRKLKYEGITGEITFGLEGGNRVENLKGFVQPIIDVNGKFQGFKSPK